VPESRQDAFTGNGTVYARWSGAQRRRGRAGERSRRLEADWEGEGLGSGTPAAGSQGINVAFALLIGRGVFWRVITRISRLPIRGNLENWKPTYCPRAGKMPSQATG
jgi:hypothetical protein